MLSSQIPDAPIAPSQAAIPSPNQETPLAPRALPGFLSFPLFFSTSHVPNPDNPRFCKKYQYCYTSLQSSLGMDP